MEQLNLNSKKNAFPHHEYAISDFKNPAVNHT